MFEETTPRLALPLLQPGQAQKEMFHNLALAQLDLVVQGAVAGASVDAPPASPAAGACWLVGASPSGAWAGHAGEIAGWTSAGWIFVVPRDGMQFWMGPEQGIARFWAGAWHLGVTHGKVFVEGDQVVGTRGEPIAEPLGGMTVDAEARAAIVSVLEALRAHGLIES